LSSAVQNHVRTNVSSQLLHDLRSPLNQIIGYSEILSEEAEGERREAFVVDLQRVRDAGHRILSLLEENFTAHADEEDVATIAVAAAARETEDAAAVPAASMPRGVDSASGLLLVVDDDAMNRDVLSRRLERQGHRVRTASSGREALQLMQEHAFEVVLLDIMMPDMDGYEVLGHLKADERLRHVPVIMISAIDEVQSVVRCIEAGAEDYLAKPFDPTLLKARIGASLEKKRGRDRESVLYEQLQKNYKRLEEVEKLRDDMRNMIVHDLRTPLTSMIVGVEMLASHGELSASQREMVGIASSGGKTLLGMINDLLDVEKMESGTARLHYRQLSAGSLLGSAVAQVGSLAEMEQTALVSAVADGLPLFAGDENRLCRTLVNLIGNAIKFTHAGTVTITASQEDPRSIRFAVRDTGAGIPGEAFERIFEKFGQLDAGHRVGTGLGLAFCKLAVEAHGGTIAVESTPGLGSTFSFTVPVVAREQPPTRIPDAT
jgi:two-component system, sensor histidine kinase and response regulator